MQVIFQRVKKYFKKLQHAMWLFAIQCIVAPAYASTSIGDPQYEPLRQWLENYQNFMTGPFAKTAVVTSVILGVLTWNFFPHNGFVSSLIRTVIAGLVLMNVTTWSKSFMFS